MLIMRNPIFMETILKVLREQSKDDDQRKTAGEIAGSVPETSLELETILKEREERGGFWEVDDGYLPEDLVLTTSPDSCKGSWHNQSPC